MNDWMFVWLSYGLIDHLKKMATKKVRALAMVVVHFEFLTYTIAFSFHKKTDRIIYDWIFKW